MAFLLPSLISGGLGFLGSLFDIGGQGKEAAEQRGNLEYGIGMRQRMDQGIGAAEWQMGENIRRGRDRLYNSGQAGRANLRTGIANGRGRLQADIGRGRNQLQSGLNLDWRRLVSDIERGRGRLRGDVNQGRNRLTKGANFGRNRLDNIINNQLLASDTTGLDAQAGRDFDRAGASLAAGMGGRRSGAGQAQLGRMQGDILAGLSQAINADQFQRANAASGLTSQFDLSTLGMLTGYDQNALGLMTGFEQFGIGQKAGQGQHARGLLTGFDQFGIGAGADFEKNALGLQTNYDQNFLGLRTGFDQNALGLQTGFAQNALGLKAGMDSGQFNARMEGGSGRGPGPMDYLLGGIGGAAAGYGGYVGGLGSKATGQSLGFGGPRAPTSMDDLNNMSDAELMEFLRAR